MRLETGRHIDKKATKKDNLLLNLFYYQKEIVFETAESFDGTSGKIKLNNAGDRVGGNYDFWVVNKNNNSKSYEWEIEHSFETAKQCPIGSHSSC